jgi:hypothetical protein
MTRLGKFLRLDRWQRRVVTEAALSVVAVRIALTILPFRWVQRITGRRAVSAEEQPGRPATATPDELASAVVRVSRSVPRATCLTQALALDWLLRRHGHAASVEIGVTKDARGQLAAHAWVESGGSVLIGGDEAARFTPLTK